MKNKSLATKVVKAGLAGTATLTRLDNRVYAMKDGATLMDKTYPSVRAAKQFMGDTLSL